MKSAIERHNLRIPTSFVGSNGREYLIGTQLGTGSSGTVFTCTDSTDDSVFAVKIVKLHHMRMSMTGSEYEFEKSKLHREVEILRHLSHPNVVKLVDVSESHDSVYIVQELIEGGELFSRITDDPDFRNENVLRFVYCQIADAVLYLHSKSVIHRDIKPENILIKTCTTRPPPGEEHIANCPVYPVVTITDFGLSKEISSMKSLAHTWVGTPQYWAPEVIRARETGTSYDGRADIWSVGVLLYVCLFRRYPFTEPKLPGDPSMQDRILKGQFNFPSQSRVSEDARDLVSKLIVADLEKRALLEETFSHPWLENFALGRVLAQRWPVVHYISVEHHVDDTVANAAVPVLVTEPSSTSRGGSPVSAPRHGNEIMIQNTQNDIVPYLFPSPTVDVPMVETEVRAPANPPHPGPILPNIALAQQTAIDQFQLSELARIQNEILICFYKIQKNFNHHPNAFHLMSVLTARARELQFLSATTVSRFAITAELAEGVIEDSSAFVEAGAIDASLSCVEEIRNSVSEMLQQCRHVQEQYRSLLDDVNNLIAGSRIVLTSDPTVRQALEDIIRTEASRSTSNTSPTKNPPIPHHSSSGSSSQASYGSGTSSTGRPSLTPTRLNLNSVVATAMSDIGSLSSPSARTDSFDGGHRAIVGVDGESTGALLSSSLRDLRRVDDILGKARFFWSNVEQCLLRLDHFKTTSFRLLANVHLSQVLMDRYKTRVSEHKAFWFKFRQTCTEYAQASQIEYQRFPKLEN